MQGHIRQYRKQGINVTEDKNNLCVMDSNNSLFIFFMVKLLLSFCIKIKLNAIHTCISVPWNILLFVY